MDFHEIGRRDLERRQRDRVTAHGVRQVVVPVLAILIFLLLFAAML